MHTWSLSKILMKQLCLFSITFLHQSGAIIMTALVIVGVQLLDTHVTVKHSMLHIYMYSYLTLELVHA